MQKSRFTHSSDARERINKIFGSEVTEKIFSIKQDVGSEALDVIMPALISYEEKLREE